MPLQSLLVANRGEIAIRVMRAAAARGLRSVAVYSEDEAGALHTRKADAAQPLRGSGAAAYLDIDGIVAAARAAGCDALHPGYGFLSENAELARRCAAAGITFVGPTPEALELFGDKARARALAQQCGIPVLEGTSGADLARGRARAAREVRGRRVADDQGGRGRRRPRRAAGALGAGAREGVRALRERGRGGVRQRRSLRGALAPARATRRGAGGGRRDRRGGALRGARVQPPAPPPEAGRDRARALALARAARARARRRGPARARRALHGPGHGGVPRRRRCARVVLLHRGERAAPGRAHRHRGGDGHRPRRAPARPRGGALARRARPRAGERARAARLCDPAAREHREAAREGRPRAARIGHAHRVRAARRDPACAPTPRGTSAMRAIRASTRCSRR